MKIDVAKYIPNTLVAAPGELELGDKLQPFLDMSSKWVDDTFCPITLLCGEFPEDKKEEEAPLQPEEEGSEESAAEYPCYSMAMKIIVAEAYRLAVPQLDLVLTSNGFATVDSKNVVPASKARTDRLLSGLLDYRDRCIQILIHRLPLLQGWLDTRQAQYFRQTLFCNPEYIASIVPNLKKETLPESSWDQYMMVLPRLSDLEDTLADEWFSPELMINLRKEKQEGTLTGIRKTVADKILNQIVAFFVTGDFKTRRLADILNMIRYDSKNFPEWINSATAELFYPPIFKNEKKSSGYFF